MNKGSGLTGHSFSPQDIPYVKGNKLDGQENDGLKVKAGAVPELSRNRQSPSDSSPDDQKISRRSVRCADSIKNTYSNGRVRAGLVKEISRALDENRVIKVNDDSQGNKKLKNLNNQLIKVLSELENSTDLSSIGKKFQEKAKEINADNPAEVARIVIDLSFDLIQWHMHGDWLDYDPRAKRLSQIDPELKDILKHFIVDMDKGLVDTDEGYDSEPDLDTEWDRELDVSEPKGQEYRAAKNVVERVQQYWATTEYLEEAKFYPVNIEPDGDNLPASLESVATQTLGTLLVDTNTEIEEGDLPDPERDELNKLRDEASEANQRATEAQDEANQLRTQVQAVQAELNDAKASTSAMTTALSGLQDQLKKVRANSGQVGKKNNTAKSEVDKNQKKIKKLEGEVSSLQHELTTVALEKSKSTLNLQSKNDNLKKENDDLIRRLSETTDEFDKNSLSGQRMVIGDRVQFELSNEKLKSLNEQNKTQHELLEQYTSRLAIAGVDHQSEVNDLRYELENLKQNSEILGGENKILREQASSLEKQLNEVKEKARKAESTAEAKRQLIPQIEINSFAKGEKTGSKTAWEDTGKKIGIYKKEISFLKKERVDLEKQLDDQEKQYRLKLHNNEEEFDDTVRELNSTLEKVQGHLNAKSDEVVDLEQKLEDKGFEFEESQIDQQTQLEEIIDLKEKLKDVRSDHSEALKAESLKVRLEDIERQLTEKSDELAKLSSQNAVINSGYNDRVKRIDDLHDEISVIEEKLKSSQSMNGEIQGVNEELKSALVSQEFALGLKEAELGGARSDLSKAKKENAYYKDQLEGLRIGSEGLEIDLAAVVKSRKDVEGAQRKQYAEFEKEIENIEGQQVKLKNFIVDLYNRMSGLAGNLNGNAQTDDFSASDINDESVSKRIAVLENLPDVFNILIKEKDRALQQQYEGSIELKEVREELKKITEGLKYENIKLKNLSNDLEITKKSRESLENQLSDAKQELQDSKNELSNHHSVGNPKALQHLQSSLREVSDKNDRLLSSIEARLQAFVMVRDENTTEDYYENVKELLVDCKKELSEIRSSNDSKNTLAKEVVKRVEDGKN